MFCLHISTWQCHGIPMRNKQKKDRNKPAFTNYLSADYLPAREEPERVLERARGAGRVLR